MPYGWAPTNWIAVQGLEKYGYKADALRVSREFTSTVEMNYTTDGTIREKYNVVSGSANVKVAAGYKTNVIGFGWTNGVYSRMHALLSTQDVAAAAGNGQ
jgi:alpha,alpha-trehalase